MKFWHGGSLAKKLNAEVILISEFVNAEIRITSTFWYFCQADTLPGFYFEKPLLKVHSCTRFTTFYTCSLQK